MDLNEQTLDQANLPTVEISSTSDEESASVTPPASSIDSPSYPSTSASTVPVAETPVSTTESVEDSSTTDAVSTLLRLSEESIHPLVVNSSDEVTKKRPSCDEYPQSSTSKVIKLSDNNDYDGLTCSICLENWSNSGDHRLTSLKCGHLFGYSCVHKWLKGSQKNNRNCPTCKTKATIRDLRYIYASKLVAFDTAEIDEVKKQLECSEEQVTKLKYEIVQSNYKLKMFQTRVGDLEKTIRTLKSQQMQVVKPRDHNWSFSLETNMDIGASNSCRVFAFNKRTQRIYVSQQSANLLFPGYGLRSVDVERKRLGCFIHLHPKPIRDLSYSSKNNMLLSVSLDKTIKILNNETIVNTIDSSNLLWSCCWDKEESNRFYVGGAAGNIQQYDIRQLSRSVYDIKSPDKTPVVSVVYVRGGILTCQLQSIRAYKKEMVNFEGDHLPVEGPFVCTSYNSKTGKILISCRPTTAHPLSRHIICRLDVNLDFDFMVEHVFEGGQIQTSMARSTFLEPDEEGSSWIAAANEAERIVNIWDVNSRTPVNQISTSDNIMDMSDIHINKSLFLTTLSQNRLRLYAARYE